ncbi:DUF885 family protein [Endozoicomonas sp. SM1973]|uniref:DUF885 family protein n=1 Tax=Spartinivicinus marinus TaxID=2994442 RepID=A0A853IE58_9GAMM|nr:DUF885 family protein [Spartinivicinus marinus]MCX4028422.1 DUF885 family protein [Spartinivicinus marinus]NYZ67465.1 DUF885 family protein [Spartinivicinus marinus]
MEQYQLFEANLINFLASDPNGSLALGIAKNLNDLPDPSLENCSARAKQAQDLINQAIQLKQTTTDFELLTDLHLSELHLNKIVHRYQRRFNDRLEVAQHPTAGGDISEGIFTLFIDDPRPAGDRLENISSRIANIPTFLHSMLGRLDTPVKRWQAIDLETVSVLPTLFKAITDWASEQKFSGLNELKKHIAQADTALNQYQRQLNQLPTTEHFSLSQDDAQQVIRNHGIELSFNELKSLSADFLHSTQQQIEELTQILTKKYQLAADTTPEALQQFLNKHYQVELIDNKLHSIIDIYKQENQKIIDFINQHDLFPVFADQQMLIEQTPKFLEPVIPAGAMRSPLPLREGTRTSLIHLTLRDDLIDEHNKLGIPVMMIHEGIPGHHLQLATSTTHTSKIRRILFAPEQAEGWTTMLEDYMLDMGYMGDLTDEARFIAKREICRIGARVAIDLFFLTGDKQYLDVGIPLKNKTDDPFSLAGELLQVVTGFTSGRVQAELNWYSAERGYPMCYLVGNQLVWQLKRDFIKKQQSSLSGKNLDRAFHQAFLSTGNMPVSIMREVFAHQQLI